MNKQKVSTVDGREVKFFDTRKEAREYNRKNGTVGVRDVLNFWPWSRISCNSNYRWFVFL